MITSRVKACVFAIAALVALGCGGTKGTKSQRRAATQDVAVGAERWSGGALLLPAQSPLVLTGRLDDALDAGRRLMKWLVAEPAMLGKDGDQIAEAIQGGWISATQYMGVDPLTTRAWVERGIDPERPFYIGVYPLSAADRRVVSTVDGVLREELGVVPHGSVTSSLLALSAAGASLPAGTRARIVRELGDRQTHVALRVVIPVASASELTTTIRSFSSGLGFKAFPAATDHAGSPDAMWSEGFVRAIAWQVDDEHAMLDLLAPLRVPASDVGSDDVEQLGQLRQRLTAVRSTTAAGRPRAPTPPGEPLAAAAFDQRGVAELIRLHGYSASLVESRGASAERRDALLLRALAGVSAEADGWSVAASDVPATTYDLTLPENGEPGIAKFSITLFGRRGAKKLDTVRTLPTLDLSRRSVALGADLGAMRRPAWLGWFGGKERADALDALDFESMRTGSSVIPALRATVLAVSITGSPQGRSVLSKTVGSALEDWQSVERAEIVRLNARPQPEGGSGEVLCALVFSKGVTEDEIRSSQGVALGLFSAFADRELPLTIIPKLSDGKTARVETEETVYHQHLVGGAHRVALLGVGLSDEDFETAVGALRRKQSIRGVVQGRLEPIALVSWLGQGEEGLLDPLDVDILAQRLGALELTYGSVDIGSNAPALAVSITLGDPPQL